MDIREFLDEIYQMFCRTTGDEHMFWIIEHVEGSMTWNLYAANAEQEQILLATFYHEVDADFTAGLHGALPDLVRRTHEALDEADRLDLQRDEQEIRIAGLESERMDVIHELERAEESINDLEDQVAQLNYELSKERGE